MKCVFEAVVADRTNKVQGRGPKVSLNMENDIHLELLSRADGPKIICEIPLGKYVAWHRDGIVGRVDEPVTVHTGKERDQSGVHELW